MFFGILLKSYSESFKETGKVDAHCYLEDLS